MEVEHSGLADAVGQTDHRKYLDKLDIISIIGQQPLPLNVKLVTDDDDHDDDQNRTTTLSPLQKTEDLLKANSLRSSSSSSLNPSRKQEFNKKFSKKKQAFLENKISE